MTTATEPLTNTVETPKCQAAGCDSVAVVRIAERWFCKPCHWSLPYWERCPDCYQQNHQRKTLHINLDGPPDLKLRTCLKCETIYYEADGGHFAVWCDGR